MDLVDLELKQKILKNRFSILQSLTKINFKNTFISRRIKGDEFEKKVYFQIEKLRGKDGIQTFSAKKTLENGLSSIRSKEFRSTDQVGT